MQAVDISGIAGVGAGAAGVAFVPPPRAFTNTATMIKAGKIAAAIERRAELDAAAASRPDLHESFRQACAGDVVAFINDWCWTYDPRNASRGLPTDVPFDLFPMQEEFVRWLGDRERGRDTAIVEKSRDMGATWLMCAYYVHHWLFVDGWSGAIGSRKQALVDKLGDRDSIMEKVRFILRRLPRWMLPRRYEDALCRIVNRDTGAAITGEGGDEMGRGGRSSMYFVDEFAFVENQMRVNAAISQNADCIIKASTPNGCDNLFCDERESGRYPVFTMHWRRHPEKDDAWYAEQCRKLAAVTVAQEIDINYRASVTTIFQENWWGYYKRDALPRTGRRVQSWDTAYKKGDENAYNARIDFLVAGGWVYVVGAWWEKSEYPELRAEFRRAARGAGEVLVEDKASGQSLIQEARRPDAWDEMPLAIVPITPDGDKVARANAATPLVKEGRVLLPEGEAWVPGFIKIFSAFPGTDCKDLVDAFSQALEYLNIQPDAPGARAPHDELVTGRPATRAAAADDEDDDSGVGDSDGVNSSAETAMTW